MAFLDFLLSPVFSHTTQRADIIPSTRSTTRLTTSSPLAGDVRSQRLRRELEIDGTAALGGGKTDQQPVKVRKLSGVSYAVAPDGISRATTGSRKRPATGELASPHQPRKDGASGANKRARPKAPSRLRKARRGSSTTIAPAATTAFSWRRSARSSESKYYSIAPGLPTWRC